MIRINRKHNTWQNAEFSALKQTLNIANMVY